MLNCNYLQLYSRKKHGNNIQVNINSAFLSTLDGGQAKKNISKRRIGYIETAFNLRLI